MKKTALLLLLVVVGMLGLWHFGRPAYRNYREQQSAQRARAFLSSGAYTNASLSARQALLLNSNNLAACRVMAELAALSHAPAELDWRRRVAELAPTIENRLLFVATCLRVEAPPYSLAVQRLAELAATAQNSAAYHELAAQLALKLGRRDEAALEFAAATRLHRPRTASAIASRPIQFRRARSRLTACSISAHPRACRDSVRNDGHRKAPKYLTDAEYARHPANPVMIAATTSCQSCRRVCRRMRRRGYHGASARQYQCGP